MTGALIRPSRPVLRRSRDDPVSLWRRRPCHADRQIRRGGKLHAVAEHGRRLVLRYLRPLAIGSAGRRRRAPARRFAGVLRSGHRARIRILARHGRDLVMANSGCVLLSLAPGVTVSRTEPSMMAVERPPLRIRLKLLDHGTVAALLRLAEGPAGRDDSTGSRPGRCPRQIWAARWKLRACPESRWFTTAAL